MRFKMCKKLKIKTCVKPHYTCFNTRFYFHKKHHFFHTFNTTKNVLFFCVFMMQKKPAKCTNITLICMSENDTKQMLTMIKI
jgi:hypothetical protein